MLTILANLSTKCVAEISWVEPLNNKNSFVFNASVLKILDTFSCLLCINLSIKGHVFCKFSFFKN